jgi:hypothetical protein
MPSDTPPRPTSPAQGIKTVGFVGDNYPTPDWSVSDDTRGLLESSVKFFTNGYGMPPFLPRRGQTHPIDSRLKCYKVTYNQADNAVGSYTADYIGLKLDPSEGEWEVSSSTSERSIVLHPNFDMFAVEVKGDPAKGVLTKWKKWVKKDKQNEFVAFFAFAPEDIGGVDSYLYPQTTARVTFYTSSSSTASKVMGSLATTRSSPFGCKNFPSVGGGGNWLLTNGSISEYGTIFRVQTEWMLSGGGKPWNKYIYKEFGG